MPTPLTISTRYDESRNANVVSLSDGREIWWEGYDAPDFRSQRINDDFALPTVLPIAMSEGRDLFIDGSVDRRLLLTLEEYTAAWAQWLPDLCRPVRISASEVKDYGRVAGASGSIVALSGGFDSTFAIHALCREADYALYERPLASVTIRGFGVPISHNLVDDDIARNAARISAHFGLEHRMLRTNWHEHCVNFVRFHPLGIAAALHQFNAIFREAFFAADYTFRQEHEIHPFGSNSITNQMLGSSILYVGNVGARVPRTLKTLCILNNRNIENLVDPCMGRKVEGMERCGRCRKCIYLDIHLLYRDREKKSLADQWRLFKRIIRFMRYKSGSSKVLGDDAAQFVKRDLPLIWLGLQSARVIYFFRKVRRSLVTGRSVKRLLRKRH